MSEKSPSKALVKPKKVAPKVTEDATDEVENTEQEAQAPAAKAKPAMKLKDSKVEVVETQAEGVEQEAEGEDLIVAVASEIEKMTENKAWKVLPQLLDSIDANYFRLGGYLARIQSEGWFMDKAYESFRAFVEAETGIEYRKAMYLIGIYNGLVESGVPWSKVGHLGWTKLKELASILTTDNMEEWVNLAENMTVLQLIAHIKEQKKASTQDASEVTEETQQITTLTFKMHADQKATVREGLAKCKSEMNTEHDAVALEHIILDYLAGDKKLKKVKTLEQQMKEKSAEEVLEVFGKVFPDVQLEATVTE
jgi:hypothetical protein